MSNALWTKESFLQEASMSKFSVDALLVQGALVPGEVYTVGRLGKLLFAGMTPAATYLRCIRACAVLQKAGRLEAVYENGRVASVISRDSIERPILQLEAQVNLALRRTPRQRAEELKASLAALYGEE